MTQLPDSDSAIFQAAVMLEPEQRTAFLERACGGNSRLRDEVESLLRAHAPNDSFLQAPLVAMTTAQPASQRPGTMVGPYKIREQIGEGGFGVVYVAEQEKPVRRKVALKVIKLGMDTRDVIARFEAERQALALMDHPNVARVLDAGASEGGLSSNRARHVPSEAFLAATTRPHRVAR
ncbi:MAG: protein kinase [Planctomycetales bacterium]|nr:protein kinase [Planctomycetales bacterium]